MKSTFQKTIFTQPQSQSTISLISDHECEIDNRGNILLAEYSRQGDKLRVVMRAGGASTVTYFEIHPDGLRESSSGQLFLLPEPLLRERQRLNDEREAAEQARQAKIAEQENHRRIQQENARMEEIRERKAEEERLKIPTNTMWTLTVTLADGTRQFRTKHTKCESWGASIIFSYPDMEWKNVVFTSQAGKPFGIVQSPNSPAESFRFDDTYKGDEGLFTGKAWAHGRDPLKFPPDWTFTLERGDLIRK